MVFFIPCSIGNGQKKGNCLLLQQPITRPGRSGHFFLIALSLHCCTRWVQLENRKPKNSSDKSWQCQIKNLVLLGYPIGPTTLHHLALGHFTNVKQPRFLHSTKPQFWHLLSEGVSIIFQSSKGEGPSVGGVDD